MGIWPKAPIYDVSLGVCSRHTVRRAVVSLLSTDEIDALVAAPDRTTSIGRRDHAPLVTALQTGLGVSELVGLRDDDVVLGVGAHVRCTGIGLQTTMHPAHPPHRRRPTNLDRRARRHR